MEGKCLKNVKGGNFKRITYCIIISLHLMEGMDVSFVLLLAVSDSVDEELLGV